MPANWQFLTPDDEPGSPEVCRPIRIPQFLFPYVNDALTALLLPENWEQSGDMTIDEITAVFDAVFTQYFEGECGTVDEIEVGQIIIDLDQNIPSSDWLPCNGSNYIRAEYPALYDLSPPQLKVNPSVGKTPKLNAAPLHQDTGYNVKFIIKGR